MTFPISTWPISPPSTLESIHLVIVLFDVLSSNPIERQETTSIWQDTLLSTLVSETSVNRAQQSATEALYMRINEQFHTDRSLTMFTGSGRSIDSEAAVAVGEHTAMGISYTVGWRESKE